MDIFTRKAFEHIRVYNKCVPDRTDFVVNVNINGKLLMATPSLHYLLDFFFSNKIWYLLWTFQRLKTFSPLARYVIFISSTSPVINPVLYFVPQ